MIKKLCLILSVLVLGISSFALAKEPSQIVPTMMLNSELGQRTFKNLLPSYLNQANLGQNTWKVWGTPFTISDRRKEDSNTYGYSTDINGFAAGASYTLTQNAALGFALGYTSGSTHNPGRGIYDSDFEALHTAIYGGVSFGHLFLDAYLGYSKDRESFDALLAHGKTDGSVWSTGIKASYLLVNSSGFNIIPSIALDYSNVDMASFDVVSNGKVRVNPADYSSVRMPLSLAVNRSFAFEAFGSTALIVPEVHASIIPQFGDRRATISIPNGSVDSYRRNRLYGSIGANLKLDVNNTVNFGLGYDYAFASKYRNHSLTGSVGIRF